MYSSMLGLGIRAPEEVLSATGASMGAVIECTTSGCARPAGRSQRAAVRGHPDLAAAERALGRQRFELRSRVRAAAEPGERQAGHQ